MVRLEIIMSSRIHVVSDLPVPKRIPKCKVRGNFPEELHLSTKKPVQPQPIPVQIPPQAPPQGEILVTEYIHNLQQQLYFLNAELRFLHDRSGVGQGPEGLSVDASIRRLRRACATHEEETNKRIQEYEKQIAELNERIREIDEGRAIEELSLADVREREGLEQLENAFVEVASEISFRQLHSYFNESLEQFSQNEETSLQEKLESQKAHLATQREDLSLIQDRLLNLKKSKKQALVQLRNSIRNRHLQNEEADYLAVVASEPERPPENPSLATIQAKNAKTEMDLKATLAARNEAERQVDNLLEKNVRLKASLNIANRDLESVRFYRDSMGQTYRDRYNQAKKVSDEQLTELSALKRARSDMKQEIAGLNQAFKEAVEKINRCQSEQEYCQSAINFHVKQQRELNEQNEATKKELHGLSDRIREKREVLDDIAKEIADAAEEEKRVQVLVEINAKDPRCQLKDPPPGLSQLLESLTAVRTAIV
jgi:hypothetical protein